MCPGIAKSCKNVWAGSVARLARAIEKIDNTGGQNRKRAFNIEMNINEEVLPDCPRYFKSTGQPGNKMKVLFHINEPDRWNRVIMNINNFLLDVGPGKAEIEVLANGAGVQPLNRSTPELTGQISDLHRQGVVFAACNNALNLHNINSDDLPPFIKVVPAGITEIVLKQSQGYAYIKP